MRLTWFLLLLFPMLQACKPEYANDCESKDCIAIPVRGTVLNITDKQPMPFMPMKVIYESKSLGFPKPDRTIYTGFTNAKGEYNFKIGVHKEDFEEYFMEVIPSSLVSDVEHTTEGNGLWEFDMEGITNAITLCYRTTPLTVRLVRTGTDYFQSVSVRHSCLINGKKRLFHNGAWINYGNIVPVINQYFVSGVNFPATITVEKKLSATQIKEKVYYFTTKDIGNNVIVINY